MARKTPPLNPSVAMVDPDTGQPTPFFMRWWQDQIEFNAAIPELNTPEAVSAVIDILDDPGPPQWGDILFRGETLWSLLAPGSSGQILASAGVDANPAWVTASFLYLSDTPSDYASQASKIVSVTLAEDGVEFSTPSAILDAEVANTHGSILYRGASGWVALAPDASSSPGFLQSQGVGSNPIWGTPASSTVSAIDDLTDVDTSTVPPSDGDILVWSAADSEWQPDTAPAVIASIDDLDDVDITTVAPSDGDVLVWSAADMEFQPEAPSGGGGGTVGAAIPESFVVALSDETTAITTGAAKVTFRMPYDFVLDEVRASVTTAPTGAAISIGINEGGVSVLSTDLTIDATEKTSTTAATPAVISDTALGDDSEITIDLDQVGSTIAGAGLKVTFIGRRLLNEAILLAVSDETSALTTGTGKITFRMPYAFTLSEVRASVTTAPTGATLTVDINEAGVSVLSTALTIDAGEKTSTTAATAAVISDTALADDAEITVDIDQVGSTIAGAGLKLYLIGSQA